MHGKNGHAFNEMILIIFKYQYLSARIFAFRYHFIFLLHIPYGHVFYLNLRISFKIHMKLFSSLSQSCCLFCEIKHNAISRAQKVHHTSVGKSYIFHMLCVCRFRCPDSCSPDTCPPDSHPPDSCPPDSCPPDSCPPDNCPSENTSTKFNIL